MIKFTDWQGSHGDIVRRQLSVLGHVLRKDELES